MNKKTFDEKKFNSLLRSAEKEILKSFDLLDSGDLSKAQLKAVRGFTRSANAKTRDARKMLRDFKGSRAPRIRIPMHRVRLPKV